MARLTLLGVMILSAACAPTLADYEQRVHVVRSGDTLYNIAWTYGLDYRSLAQWNGLTDPNRIVVGQRLILSSPAQSMVQNRSDVVLRQPVQRPSPRVPAPLPPPQWQWPTAGRVSRAFGAPGGIDSGIGISGGLGQQIVASADGRVVYAGSGLIGYGQLVIIKHNDTFLSAYGHMQEVQVTQGQEVRRGQTIAQMGLGPQRQPLLHFEIRRDGVPVDPLAYLSGPRS